MRSVTVNAVLNGWTVQCGCQTLVYTDPDKLTGDLRDYLRDPKAKEAAVIASAVNKAEAAAFVTRCEGRQTTAMPQERQRR